MSRKPPSIAIVYCSQTGFTKRYAAWLSEELGCVATPFLERDQVDLAGIDILVFCSWFHAASIKGAKWLKKVMRDHPDIDAIVLATGATPMPADMQLTPEMEEAFAKTFPAADYPDLPHFYCQGGFDFERLGLPDKIAMRMFFKAKSNVAKNNPEAAEMLRVMRAGFDGTKREYLEPVLAYLQSKI